MNSLITFGSESKPLDMFSLPHLIAIAVILLSCIFLVIFRKKFYNNNVKLRFRYTMSLVILVQEILLYYWYIKSGVWSVSWTLPIQLCDISIFLCIFSLLTKNRFVYELVYFWGFGGATQAILTPDIGNYTFPHFVFYQFFLGHALILLTCIYIVGVENFKPTFKSVIRVFIITNIYAVIIYPINLVTGGNYLFLRVKPQGDSIISLLGPWPWYILWLEGVAIVLYLLLYLPFAFKGKQNDTPISF